MHSSDVFSTGSGSFQLYRNFLKGSQNEIDSRSQSLSYYQNSTILLNNEEVITRSTEQTEQRANFLYKNCMKMIEKHLMDKQHPINKMIHFYLEEFPERLKSFRKEIEENSIELSSNNNIALEKTEELLKDVHSFFEIIRNSVYTFYNFSELVFKIKKTFKIVVNLFTFENLTNFLTAFFFQKLEIYDYLLDFLSFSHRNQEAILQKNLKTLKYWVPMDFGVSSAFSLDNNTAIYLKKKQKIKEIMDNKQKKKEVGSEEFKETTNKKYCFPPKEPQGKSLSNPPLSFLLKKKDNLQENCQMPYEKAIKILKKFEKIKSPIHQLKLLGLVFEAIIECISEFYLKYNIFFEKNIESDELISIVLYIISKSEMENALSHIKIIETFMTKNYTMTLIGYQFVTLKVCLNYIENLSDLKERNNQKYGVSVLRESILIDIKKEAESQNDKKSINII